MVNFKILGRSLPLVFVAISMPASAEVPSRVQELVAELRRPGCPKLFDQLTRDFQQAAPRESWAGFCETFARNGAVRSLVEAGVEKGFTVYRLTLEKAERNSVLPSTTKGVSADSFLAHGRLKARAGQSRKPRPGFAGH